MKNIAILVASLLSVLTVLSSGSTNEITARFPYKIISWHGKEGSGASVAEVVPDPSTVTTNSSGIHTSTTPGQEHELRPAFVGQAGKKDVYRFIYKHPKDGTNSNQQITTSKDVQFDGGRVVVFQDEQRTIVMTTPTAEDLKQASPAVKAAK